MKKQTSMAHSKGKQNEWRLEGQMVDLLSKDINRFKDAQRTKSRHEESQENNMGQYRNNNKETEI